MAPKIFLFSEKKFGKSSVYSAKKRKQAILKRKGPTDVVLRHQEEDPHKDRNMSGNDDKTAGGNGLRRRYRPVWVGLRGRGRSYRPDGETAGAAAQDGAAALDGATAGAGGQLPTGADAGPGGQQLAGAAAREGADALDWDWEHPPGYRRPVPLDEDDDDDDQPPHEEDRDSAVAELEAGLAAAANGPPHIGGGDDDGVDDGGDDNGGADNGSAEGGHDDEVRGGEGDDEDGGLHTPPSPGAGAAFAMEWAADDGARGQADEAEKLASSGDPASFQEARESSRGLLAMGAYFARTASAMLDEHKRAKKEADMYMTEVSKAVFNIRHTIIAVF